jgi:hypothetical protein
MAEIDIQKKQRGPVWPWVLGAVLLLAAVGLLLVFVGQDDPTVTEPRPTAAPVDLERPGVDPVRPANGAVEAYLEFGREPEEVDVDMGRHHEYTQEGLQRAVAALDEVIRADTVGQRPLEERLDRVRDRADRITRDPASPEHANQVREAFTEIADLMEDVRGRRVPDQPPVEERVRATREAAEAIDPGTPLLEQREAVRRFFRESGQALDRLRGTTR